MTPELIYQWAREAGAYLNQAGRLEIVHIDKLMAFAALVAAHEREECARVCDEESSKEWHIEDGTYYVADYCAAAIRARK